MTKDGKKVYIEDLREGMVLSDDVVDRRGMVLLPGGTLLTKSNFSALEKSGIRSVWVQNVENVAADTQIPGKTAPIMG